MNPTIDKAFNEAEQRYLNAEELGVVTEYVDSLPDRMELYRTLRDKELTLLQPVADRLQQQFPETDQKLLERVIKNGILALRSCSMAMLLNDDRYVQERVQWLQKIQKNYESYQFDSAFYDLLERQLKQSLSASQQRLLQPGLDTVKTTLQSADPKTVVDEESQEDLSVASLF